MPSPENLIQDRYDAYDKAMQAEKLQYTPLRDLILLKAKRTEEKSDGGIIIPEQARDTLNEGEVVSIGPDATTQGCSVAIGDTVVFTKHSEYRIQIDDEIYIAVTWFNILLQKLKD